MSEEAAQAAMNNIMDVSPGDEPLDVPDVQLPAPDMNVEDPSELPDDQPLVPGADEGQPAPVAEGQPAGTPEAGGDTAPGGGAACWVVCGG